MNNQLVKADIGHSKSLILSGFSTILIIIALIIGYWFKSLSDNQNILGTLGNNSYIIQTLTNIGQTLRKQQALSHQIITATTTARPEAFYQDFRRNHELFAQLNLQLTTQLSNISMDVGGITINSTPNNNFAIISLLHEFENSEYSVLVSVNKGDSDNARKIINQLLDIDNPRSIANAIQRVDRFIMSTRHSLINTIISGESTNNSAYYLVVIFSVIAVSLGIFTVLIIKRTSKTESRLVDQGKRIQLLYEATSNSGLSLDDRITETLKLGCRVLGMEIGKLGSQDPEKNASLFLNTVAPSDLPARRGLVLPLDKTFCNITFSTDGPIAIHHVSTSSYKDHPAAKFLGMEAYLGTTIYVHDKKFGTVNFSNRKPMESAFTQADVDFVNLLGKWISVTMEQIITEESLQKSKDAADAANQAKTTFLANMSHEIRTPLTAILGYSEMLLDDDQSPEEMEHEINAIISSGSHLQQIINDILDLSKIEAGQLVIENRKFSPVVFTDELNPILRPQALNKGLSFNVNYQYPLPAEIVTDPTRLKQILINLCGNAIKFTANGHVTLSIAYLSETNQLEISVTDTGIGMTEDEQKRLFKPFSQADESTTRIFGGTGLGLCISRQLAQKLGGDVTIQSEKGSGSVFTFQINAGIDSDKLKLLTGPDLNIHQSDIKIPTDTRLLTGHVLLVEDNIDNQKFIAKFITRLGLSVDIANNGKEAIKRVTNTSYDLVLMDIQMPVMDGLEATKYLRSSGFSIPIINLTANAMQEDRKKCFDAGADDYLAKPIDSARFYSVLAKHLAAQHTVMPSPLNEQSA
ncbi:MAG: response regulator, partial [Ectothiorhodospiraceae bacterium]|nr:response regulator [Ectothiorhodospiraceae bacterium]